MIEYLYSQVLPHNDFFQNILIAVYWHPIHHTQGSNELINLPTEIGALTNLESLILRK